MWLVPTAVAWALAVAGCGGASGTGSPSPGPTPTPPPASGGTTITITSSGVTPKMLTVSPGTRVTVINSDTVAHDMESDPHPDHTDCVEINQVGFLLPRQSRQTGNLNSIRTCGFHDHDQPTNQSLNGQIVIR